MRPIASVNTGSRQGAGKVRDLVPLKVIQEGLAQLHFYSRKSCQLLYNKGVTNLSRLASKILPLVPGDF